MILSTQASTSIEDVTKARGQPIWYQLYATNKFEVAKHHVQRAEKAGALAVAVTVDRNGGRNQEDLARMRRLDTRTCTNCHDNSSVASSNRDVPMYQGADLSGLTNVQSPSLTWETIKRLRDATRMKIMLKGILAYEDAALAAEFEQLAVRGQEFDALDELRSGERLDDEVVGADGEPSLHVLDRLACRQEGDRHAWDRCEVGLGQCRRQDPPASAPAQRDQRRGRGLARSRPCARSGTPSIRRDPDRPRPGSRVRVGRYESSSR